MNRKIALLMTLLSSSVAAEVTHTSNQQIDIPEILAQAPVYNEENGYWNNPEKINREMLRDLMQMNPQEWSVLRARNESNGYW